MSKVWRISISGILGYLGSSEGDRRYFRATELHTQRDGSGRIYNGRWISSELYGFDLTNGTHVGELISFDLM